MDALGAAAGSVVADIGAGRGYFTFHLAGRVGAQGKVYAVDLDKRELERLKERAAEAGLAQIETVNSLADDPLLPEGALDAVLVVNAYHEMREFDAMLRGMFKALKPGGRLVIVDQSAINGKPRDEYFRSHKISEEVVREDAQRNGFRLVRKEDDIITGDKEHWFFLVFEKPRPE
jgi:predicted methyltransferase